MYSIIEKLPAAPDREPRQNGGITMKRIKTLTTKNLKESMKKGGCGECQTSCQSACKTSCTVGNQSCEHK
jgi:predicted ribosomally synthesized six-cysteine peptide SCIFF